MNKAKSLLFTSDEATYKNYAKKGLFEFYAAKNIAKTVAFINDYLPEYILIDFAVSREDKTQCLDLIEKKEKYSPVIIIAKGPNIEEIVSNKRNIFMSDANHIDIPAELERKIDYMLMKLKFSVRHKGYEYIKRVIFEGIYNPSILDSIKKQLYQKIATEFDTTVFSVERGITFAIKRAYEMSQDDEELRRHFEFCGNKTTNSVFLKNLLMTIKYLTI